MSAGTPRRVRSAAMEASQRVPRTMALPPPLKLRLWPEKNVCVVFLRCAGEAGERLPLGKSEQFCAYLLFVGALAARLSDG
jgi:hypothetical protein